LVLLESWRCLLSNGIMFARIEARMRELWLPEAGVCKKFFSVFPVKILGKPKMLSMNRELHVAVEVALFLKVPVLQINSQRVEKTLRPKVVS
jgi:hypothetical protein